MSDSSIDTWKPCLLPQPQLNYNTLSTLTAVGFHKKAPPITPLGCDLSEIRLVHIFKIALVCNDLISECLEHQSVCLVQSEVVTLYAQ